jgi:hypothetical protein
MMPHHIYDRTQLRGAEKRIAFLHLSELDNSTIAFMMETSMANVRDTLNRPHVAKFIAQQRAIFVDDIRPVMRDMNLQIKEHTERAWEVEKDVMERLYQLGDDNKDYVRAQLGAAATAQDILDRAGNRAPTKILQKNEYSIAPESLSELERIMTEANPARLAPNEAGSESKPTTINLPMVINQQDSND